MKILITGGRSAIAQALAARQIAQGHEVVVTASSVASAAEVTKLYAARKIAADVVTFPLDPSALFHESLEAVLEEGVDALVLNASPPIKRFKLAHQFSTEEIREALAVNVEGNVRLVQRVLPQMTRRRFGRLVFVSSAMVATGTSRHGLYCMTKSAMEAFFVNLAVDYSAKNVLANVLRPGIVKTERTARFWKKEGYLEKAKVIPQGALGEPEQIAEVFDPLLSKTSYMTGSIVTVSGGLPLMKLGGL